MTVVQHRKTNRDTIKKLYDTATYIRQTRHAKTSNRTTIERQEGNEQNTSPKQPGGSITASTQARTSKIQRTNENIKHGTHKSVIDYQWQAGRQRAPRQDRRQTNTKTLELAYGGRQEGGD